MLRFANIGFVRPAFTRKPVMSWLIRFGFSVFDTPTLHLLMNDNTQLARLEYEVGNFFNAVKFSQYALARDNDDADAWVILGLSLMKRCDFIGAIDALENAALICPLDNDGRFTLAVAYGAVGRATLSRDLLMALATSGHVDAPELLKIAAGLEAVDEPVLAMESCRQAGKIAPDAALVHYQMGYYATLCNYPPSVSEALIRHAVGLEPKNVHFRIGLASLLIRLDRKEEAMAALDSTIPDRLGEVTCKCCLKRIANVFFDCDDVERARLCATRLATLETEGTKGVPHAKPASRETVA